MKKYSRMDFERQKLALLSLKKQSLIPVLLVSLGLHLALCLLVLTFHQPHELKKDSSKKSAIRARLVYTSTVLETQQQILPKIAAPNPDVVQKEPEQKQLSAIDDINTMSKKELESNLSKRRDALPAAEYSDEKNNQASLLGSKPVDVDSSSLAQRHLQTFSQQADQRLAQRESALFRESKNSPDLQLPSIDPFLTEDQKYLQKKTVKVNCSLSFSKVIANLSGALGGIVRCTEMPEIGDFIEKRMNKTSLLEEP